MAWTAPHTYLADEPLTADQLNNDLYYNMLETMPAKATNDLTDNPLFFYISGNNTIVGRERGYQFIKNIGTRTSFTFGDCTEFVGPTVSLTTGTKALIMWGCQPATTSNSSSTGDHETQMGYTVSGASTKAAEEERSLMFMQGVASVKTHMGFSQWDMRTDLTPGVNTFTCKYRARNFDVANSTGEWRWPTLIVIPL